VNKIGGKWKILIILERIIYAEIPPRVEYKITAYGQSLMPVISVLQEWGLQDLKSK
jgi:DNA-binding HxlR family transcriptional regulator